MGVLGFSHLYFFNEKTRGRLNLTLAGLKNSVRVDSLFENGDKTVFYGNNSSEGWYALSYNLHKKYNAKNTLSLGFDLNRKHYNYADSSLVNNTFYKHWTDFEGSANIFDGFVQWKHRVTDSLSFYTGLHLLHFGYNNTKSLEPRLGLKWRFTQNQIISLGLGLHSQTQVMSYYLFRIPDDEGNFVETNKDLDFSKSLHTVLRYDYNFTKNMRLRLEAYYQHLYHIPVEREPSAFAVLNEGGNFYFQYVDNLINEGTGKNYGLELTLEKFFSDNYYFLLTGTLYESKYVGSDGIERNTAFNGNFILNALGGMEINLDKKSKYILSFNIKTTYAGGKRFIPVDLEASRAAGETVYIYEAAFENRQKDFFRLDARVGFKLNGQKTTQEWALDVQNITDRKNIFQKTYDKKTQEIRTEYQMGRFPVFLYRILF